MTYRFGQMTGIPRALPPAYAARISCPPVRRDLSKVWRAAGVSPGVPLGLRLGLALAFLPCSQFSPLRSAARIGASIHDNLSKFANRRRRFMR
jgi:hypothetical protein